MKDKIKILLKFTFSITLVYLLLRSGKLDLSLIKQSLESPLNPFLCFILLMFQAIIASYRWGIILRTETITNIKLTSLFKVSWIGMFFNALLPGAVTGDLIKLIYAKDFSKKLDKTFLITSVMLDRIIGLIGLLFILGFGCILYYKQVTSISSQMKNLVNINILLFIAGIIFLFLLFIPIFIQKHLHSIFLKIPFLGNFISNITKKVWILGASKATIIKALLLSILLQFMNIFAFWILINPFLKKAIPFEYLFTFIPSGLIAVAVPISPGGMGVGHLIFDQLFSYVNIKNGASFFNLYFIIVMIINLLGIFPYLAIKKTSPTKNNS